MSAAPIGVGTSQARLQAWFWIFVAGYCALGLVTLTNEHPWGDDWAQYVLHARNLATGRPYSDTGYLFNPDVAYLGPASYPPGLPLLLAPFVAAFGINITALKVAGLACIVLVLPVALRLMAPVTGMPVALVAMVLLALHPVFWHQRQVINSEAPYLLFSILTLWWCARPAEAHVSRHAALRTGLILGILLYASVISRSIGIVILPALLAYGWAQRKPLGWFAGLVFTFSLLLWLQSLWLVAPPIYQSELRVPTIGAVSAKPSGYLSEFADLSPLPFGLSPVGAAIMILASAAGAWFACSQAQVTGRGLGRLRAIAAGVPVFVWYLASYLSALVLASVEPNSRLLLPILPIMLLLAAYGVHELAIRRFKSVALSLGAGLACAVYLLALQASGRYTPDEQMATCKECMEMFAYVREHSAPESVIVFNKPRTMALFGDRRSWIASQRYRRDQLVRQMTRLQSIYVVAGVLGSEFGRRFPTPAAVRARTEEPDAEVVFRNNSFVVVRLGATRPPS